jgi:glycosyltransferase involved in cell wall biosynthesis
MNDPESPGVETALKAPQSGQVGPVDHADERGAVRPRVVITHDFMETYGGAERVTAEMARAFPDAPVVAILGRASVASRMGLGNRFRTVLPAREKLLRHYRLMTPAVGKLVDSVRVPAADVVLSSSYAFAHRFRSTNDAPRVCYCHSPLRFAWSMTENYRDRFAGSRATQPAFDLLARSVRSSDWRSAQSIYQYLTQSPFTAEQIERFYGRRAEVIGAPVDCDLFHPGGSAPEDYFLFCGRLTEPYKRVGVAVEAFRQLGARLLVAGDGPALPSLAASAPPNVEFLGHVNDDELVPIIQRCQALVFPSRDDFGLTPVEVMACGRPVLAYAGGGSLHTSVPGVTGQLFHEQSAEALARAVREFRADAYDSERIREHALQWDSRRFRERLVEHVQLALSQR